MPDKPSIHHEGRHESEQAVAAQQTSTILQHVPRQWQGWRGHLPVVVDVVSTAVSEALYALGGSPFTGDMSRTGIDVPIAATPDQQHRYLFRLVTIDIPNGSAAVVLGVHTAHTLRAVLAGTDSAGDCAQPFEIMVKDPFWAPRQGNVSWHARVQQLKESPVHLADSCLTSGNDTYVDGQGTALLHLACPITGAYVPPAKGEPPGRPLGHIGTWYDNRDWATYIPVYGPARVGLYASVHQFTNTLCEVTLPSDLGALNQEDRFLIGFPAGEDLLGAKYGRVAGALSVELWPDCDDLVDFLGSGAGSRLFQQLGATRRPR